LIAPIKGISLIRPFRVILPKKFDGFGEIHVRIYGSPKENGYQLKHAGRQVRSP
jgi:hypothetical protein